MTTDTLTAPGPVVRMCEDPDCRGGWVCPTAARNRARITSKKTMGMVEVDRLGLGDAAMVALLAQEIALSGPSDSSGVQHAVPDGCEFTVHRGRMGVPEDKWPAADGEYYMALYSGLESDVDAILADTPRYPDDPDFFTFTYGRHEAMREAGVFAAVGAARARIAAA